jgi:hypothetical protein
VSVPDSTTPKHRREEEQLSDDEVLAPATPGAEALGDANATDDEPDDAGS